mgnify:FL=1
MAEKRNRNFATVVYPESAPENWIDILSDFHIPAFVSPLHQFDVNPSGDVKKAHFHVLVMFEGLKSISQVKELFSSFGGVGCETVNSIRGMARYLCHLDNPEKYQYNPVEVKAFGGADYACVVELETDRVKIIADMQEWCRAEGCVSLSELYDYSRVYNYDWFRALATHCNNVMAAYLKSLKWTIEHPDEVQSCKNASQV